MPLAAATAFATRRVTTRECALAKLHGGDGAEGIGFCYAEAEAAAAVETRARFLIDGYLTFISGASGRPAERLRWISLTAFFSPRKRCGVGG